MGGICHLNGCWKLTAELLIMLQSVEAKFNKNSIRHSQWEDPHVPLIFFFFYFLGFRPRNWMEILFKPALVYQLLVNIRFSVDSHYALHFEQREEIKWCISLYIHIFTHLLPLLIMKLWLTQNAHHYFCKFRVSPSLLQPQIRNSTKFLSSTNQLLPAQAVVIWVWKWLIIWRQQWRVQV